MSNKNIEHIEKLQAEIASYGEFPKDVLQKINYKLRLDWNYFSNKMEGGTLTREETRSVMSGVLNLKDKSKKDFREMDGHNNVVIDIFKIQRGEMRLSELRIKSIHEQIMFDENPDKNKEIGHWKTSNNHIINVKGEKFNFIDYNDVPEKMHDLLNQLNAYLDLYFENPKKAKKHPVEVAAQFHIDFLTIHPFYDGNGRLARILSNLILISCGYPIFIINMEDKNVYNLLLGDIQGYGGDNKQFIDFISEKVINTQEIILKALKGENIEEEDDLDKEIELLKRKQKITPQPIKKSKESIKNVIQRVYLPILKEVDKIGLKFNTLFENVQWVYFYNPNTFNDFVRGNLNAVIDRLKKEANGVDFDLENIKFNLYLLKYKDDKSFNIELAVRINFYEEKFNVEVITGIPMESGIGFTIFKELVEAFSSVDKIKVTDGEQIQLLESGYDIEVTQQELKFFNTQISRILLNYIKNKTTK